MHKKVTKFHSESVKNESARTKNCRVVCAKRPPPLKEAILTFSTVEAKCTVNLHKDDNKRENEGMQETLVNSALKFICFII